MNDVNHHLIKKLIAAGLAYFEDQFSNGGGYGCKSVVSCFFNILYNGNLGDE